MQKTAIILRYTGGFVYAKKDVHYRGYKVAEKGLYYWLKKENDSLFILTRVNVSIRVMVAIINATGCAENTGARRISKVMNLLL